MENSAGLVAAQDAVYNALFDANSENYDMSSSSSAAMQISPPLSNSLVAVEDADHRNSEYIRNGGYIRMAGFGNQFTVQNYPPNVLTTGAATNNNSSGNIATAKNIRPPPILNVLPPQQPDNDDVSNMEASGELPLNCTVNVGGTPSDEGCSKIEQKISHINDELLERSSADYSSFDVSEGSVPPSKISDVLLRTSSASIAPPKIMSKGNKDGRNAALQISDAIAATMHVDTRWDTKSCNTTSTDVPCSPANSESMAANSFPSSTTVAGDENTDSSEASTLKTQMPITNISRIMKRALPSNAKVTKKSKEIIQDTVTAFIQKMTAEAYRRGDSRKRRIITGDDILWSLRQHGFRSYSELLEEFLQRLRDSSQSHSKNSSATYAPNGNLDQTIKPTHYTSHPPLLDQNSFAQLLPTTTNDTVVPQMYPKTAQNVYAMSGGRSVGHRSSEVQMQYYPSALNQLQQMRYYHDGAMGQPYNMPVFLNNQISSHGPHDGNGPPHHHMLSAAARHSYMNNHQFGEQQPLHFIYEPRMRPQNNNVQYIQLPSGYFSFLGQQRPLTNGSQTIIANAAGAATQHSLAVADYAARDGSGDMMSHCNSAMGGRNVIPTNGVIANHLESGGLQLPSDGSNLGYCKADTGAAKSSIPNNQQQRCLLLPFNTYCMPTQPYNT